MIGNTRVWSVAEIYHVETVKPGVETVRWVARMAFADVGFTDPTFAAAASLAHGWTPVAENPVQVWRPLARKEGILGGIEPDATADARFLAVRTYHKPKEVARVELAPA